MNRLLVVARAQVVEGNSRIQCDGFGFFLLTYSCSTGHLDTDFFSFWNEHQGVNHPVSLGFLCRVLAAVAFVVPVRPS